MSYSKEFPFEKEIYDWGDRVIVGLDTSSIKRRGVGVEELGTKKWSLTEFHEIWVCWLWIISLQHIKKLEGCFSDFRWNLDTFLWQVSEKAYDRGETVSLSVRFLQIYETNDALIIYLRNFNLKENNQGHD